MDFENKKARLNFLKYAFTSIDKEHLIPEGYRTSVLSDIVNSEHIEEIDDFFSTGVINCLKLSKRKGKEEIDEETTDKYFLGPHNKISVCKACEGVVTKVNKKTARIETPEGNRRYRTILEPDLKLGYKVIVHGDYVIKMIK